MGIGVGTDGITRIATGSSSGVSQLYISIRLMEEMVM